MVKSSKWYYGKISDIADIIQEIQNDSKEITLNRIISDLEVQESTKIRD